MYSMTYKNEPRSRVSRVSRVTKDACIYFSIIMCMFILLVVSTSILTHGNNHNDKLTICYRGDISKINGYSNYSNYTIPYETKRYNNTYIVKMFDTCDWNDSSTYTCDLFINNSYPVEFKCHVRSDSSIDLYPWIFSENKKDLMSSISIVTVIALFMFMVKGFSCIVQSPGSNGYSSF
jgi:hypothetical protein